jgi:hypothetical protein
MYKSILTAAEGYESEKLKELEVEKRFSDERD